MEIAFCSQELRALFESAKTMRTKFGADAADTLMTLLSELRAAESVDDLVDIDISAAPNGPSHSVLLSPNNSAHVRIEANHIKLPLNDDGAIAWGRVYMIKVMEVRNGG